MLVTPNVSFVSTTAPRNFVDQGLDEHRCYAHLLEVDKQSPDLGLWIFVANVP